jgi:hypothetical protein
LTFDLQTVKVTVAKLVGFFYIGSGLPQDRYSQVGFVMLAALAVMAWLRRDRLDRYFLLFVAMWTAVCALVVVRIPIGVIHPFIAGPRYFFYPFILMTWAGLWIAAVSGPIVRSILATLYIAAVWTAANYAYQPDFKYFGFRRGHDHIDWAAHVRRCAQSEKYNMPIHHDGRMDTVTFWTLTGEQCRALLANSVFRTTPH